MHIKRQTQTPDHLVAEFAAKLSRHLRFGVIQDIDDTVTVKVFIISLYGCHILVVQIEPAIDSTYISHHLGDLVNLIRNHPDNLEPLQARVIAAVHLQISTTCLQHITDLFLTVRDIGQCSTDSGNHQSGDYHQTQKYVPHRPLL